MIKLQVYLSKYDLLVDSKHWRGKETHPTVNQVSSIKYQVYMLAPNLGKQTKTISSVNKIMCTLPHFWIFVKFENQLQNLIFHKVFDKGNSWTSDGKILQARTWKPSQQHTT